MRSTRVLRWLALLGVASAAAIAANVVLLDLAQSQDEAVGKLSPRVLLQTDAPATSTPGDTAPSGSTGPAITDPASTRTDSEHSSAGSDETHDDEHGSTRGEDDDD
jgi:hypothetical protein